MKFTKMHGIGNDYVYVDCARETVTDPVAAAIKVSDRHFGIGSDGLILIKPVTDDVADFEMVMYNADGSKSNMCGNGIRCVAKFVYDKGLTQQTELRILTGDGVKTLELTVQDGQVAAVRVNMGTPQLQAEKIPIVSENEQVLGQPITIDGTVYSMTGVSMGNPHAVVFVDDVEAVRIEKTGPLFEFDKAFPERVNAEFVKVLDDHTLQMRVWERGTGETLACGTGACAAAVAAILNGYTKEEVTVRLLGGDLNIVWDRKADNVYMTGSATTVFEGEITL
ncbi:MAG: diaminopimelate epimerase [Lachnospiraceae bacterium]